MRFLFYGSNRNSSFLYTYAPHPIGIQSNLYHSLDNDRLNPLEMLSSSHFLYEVSDIRDMAVRDGNAYVILR